VAWEGNDRTQFEGVKERWCQPGAPSVREALEAAFGDTALVYQFLINEDLDSNSWAGSSSPGYQNHSGSGRGCLLGLPLSTSNFNHGIASYVDADDDAMRYAEIDCSAASDTSPNKELYRWPIYIPDGHTQIDVHIRASENFWEIAPKLRLYVPSFASGASVTSTLTEDGTGFFYISKDADGKGYYFPVTVASPGQLHVLGLDVNLDECADTVKIFSIRVLPRSFYAVRPDDAEDIYAGPRSADYDPVPGTQYTKIGTAYSADGRTVPSIATHTAAANANYVHKLTSDSTLDGVGVAGGHDHDGADSATIEVCLASCCVGWTYINPSSGDGGASGAAGEDETGLNGTEAPYGGDAPTLDTPTSGTGSGNAVSGPLCAFYAPRRNSGSITLNWAVVMNDVDNTDGHVRCETSDAITDSPFDNVGSYVDCTSPPGWLVAQGTATGYEGAINYTRFSFYGDTDHTAGGPTQYTSLSLNGFCFWAT